MRAASCSRTPSPTITVWCCVSRCVAAARPSPPPPALISASRSGLGALELYCMGLKATGTYLSRTLSYAGAEFRLDMIDIAGEFKVRI